MEMHGGDRRADDFGSTSYPHPDDRSPHIFNREHSNEFNGHHHHQVGSHQPPLAGQKRQFHHPNGGFDCGGFVKLYVVGITRMATEQDIMAVFGEYGHIIEVVLLKDKRTGLQQEACFVKYATVDQADRAIVAFHQYTFPGATIQMKVKYADGERERLGSLGVQVSKLYIGCLNRQASRWDIEEIFAPFGIIEEIFVVRDEFKQNRGCAFVQFSCRDMAIAAIQALHGSYVMRGCDQPLIVRFADPKKPRVGDPRPTSCMNDPSNGNMPSSHEMWQMKSSHSGCNTSTISSTNTAPSVHTANSVAETEHSIECDWSEHVSPDGDLYYYNCVTCESTWEKPEEYSLYEQELDKLEEEHPHLGSNQWAFSSPDMSEAQKVI